MTVTPRTAIWVSVVVQGIGLAIDGVWHGAVGRGFEPRTRSEMAKHLASVHVVLYVGVLALLASIAWALVTEARRSSAGLALPVAFAGAAVQSGGELWHAYSHLALRPKPAPELIGFTAIVALVVWRRSGRRTESNTESRRAA